MAEALLSGVLRKVAEFTVGKVVEKFQSLYNIREEVEKLSRELSYIHAFMKDIDELIKDVDEKHVADHRQMQLMKDLMDIAYQIEDAVDIFLEECPEDPPEENTDKPPSIVNRFKGLAIKTTQIPFLSNFEHEIKRIQRRIREIEEYRQRYEIHTLGSEDLFGENKMKNIDPDLKLDPIGDPEVVGFAGDIDKVVKCLLDDTNNSLAVVSIVGPGGIGKTTLARKVCHSNDVVKSFGKPIWITISQKYNVFNILRKIAQDLNIKSDNLYVNELANLIRESLEKRMYLIVLDDTWTEDLWVEIANVIPDSKNGSRVLVTTRFQNVAKKADTTYDPYELPVLDYEQSLELFLKKAVPKRHQCPDGPTTELRNLAKKFIAKCKGLPLALVVLGGLLSIRPYKFHAWNELLQTMSWHDDGSACTKVIATSYDHLPFAKKLCFLYFAAFPEDQEIESASLLRMWVAERLIPREERRTLEETAACFLEDLVQRSMIQVSERRLHDGSIKHCRVHDIMRDFAVQKAKDINFLIVCSNPDDRESCSKARRVAIHYSYVNEPLDNYVSSNVRSLFFFDRSSKLDYSKYRVLRVLYLGREVKWLSFRGSVHLRYLQMRTDLEEMLSREFGEWVRGMKYLETLDLRRTHHGDLSDWIWQVKTLRHVLLGNMFSGKTQGPPASVDLSNLQTLRGVRWNELWNTSSLPNIPRVRDLGIEIDEKIATREVANFLGRLKHVVYLRIQGFVGLQRIATGGCPLNENLKSLKLIKSFLKGGKSLVSLFDNMLPSNLTQLRLSHAIFESDPMPVLEKLESLKELFMFGIFLIKKSRVCRRIRCSAGGFKQLEFLWLEIPCKEWEIEMGAMPMLKRLQVNCDPLRVPLEVIHLHSLQCLYWKTGIQTNKYAISDILEQRPNMKYKSNVSPFLSDGL